MTDADVIAQFGQVVFDCAIEWLGEHPESEQTIVEVAQDIADIHDESDARDAI